MNCSVPLTATVGFNGAIVNAPAPVPESAINCGLPAPESVKFSVAVRVPAAVGLNTTAAVQLVDAARLVPHVLLAMLKSPAFVPEIAIPLIVMDVVKPFDSVPACDALATPTAVLAKERVAGLAVTLPEAPVPSPESATV